VSSNVVRARERETKPDAFEDAPPGLLRHFGEVREVTLPPIPSMERTQRKPLKLDTFDQLLGEVPS